MRIARWDVATGGERRRGLRRSTTRVVPFPDGLTVADVLAGGLDAAHELFARCRDDADGARRWPTSGCSRRSCPPRSATSSRSRSTSRESAPRSTARARWCRSGTRRRPSTSRTRTPCSAPAKPCRRPSPSGWTSNWRSPPSSAASTGSDGANLTPEAAASHIFGYTIMNDWSARDIQAREMKVRLGPAKGKDFGTSLGPWIVTADELAAVPRRRRIPRGARRGARQRRADRRGPRLEHGLAVPGAGRLRVAQLAGRARATCSDRAPSATADASASCGDARRR